MSFSPFTEIPEFLTQWEICFAISCMTRIPHSSSNVSFFEVTTLLWQNTMWYFPLFLHKRHFICCSYSNNLVLEGENTKQMSGQNDLFVQYRLQTDNQVSRTHSFLLQCKSKCSM